MAEIAVRRLRADEWRELRALRLRALADAPDAFGASLADEEAEPDIAWQARAAPQDGAVVVAESGGRLVGMAFAGPSPAAEHVAGLYSMWVEPAVRGTSVAAHIVESVVDWTRRQGYTGLGLGVTTTNHRAIAFYQRLGFVDAGLRYPLRPGASLEIMIMTMPLEP